MSYKNQKLSKTTQNNRWSGSKREWNMKANFGRAVNSAFDTGIQLMEKTKAQKMQRI